MPRGKTPAATVSPATLLGSSADTFGIHASNSDAWAPPDKELGLTLSQVLHRPSRHSRSRETEAKQSRPNSGKDEAVFDSESSDPHHAPDDDVALGFAVRNLKSIQPDDSAAAESPIAKLEPTETDSGQLAAIAAMFDDDDDDGYIDDTKRTRQVSISSRMDFMDEESAQNYERILANSRKERSDKRRASRASSSSSSRPAKDHVSLAPKVENESMGLKAVSRRKSPPPNLDLSSVDELPDDPLADMPLPGRQDSMSTTPSKRKRHAPLRVCDSEASDENEVLDERAIIHQRLRNKPAPSSTALSRFEQARLNMQRKTYASDSDSGESQSIDAYDSAGGMAAATVDTLDTDSEDEQTARNDIMIIRDSSEEDNDFVSDPEDPLPYSRVAGRSGKSREKLDTFLSKFTPQRRRHVQQQKLNWRPGSAATKTHRTRTSPSRTTPKSVKGYSQELDDDIADFIVDDDAVECPAEVSASRHISASAYDSDASARPKFSRGGPDGVMALMPDEFSMFDLPTSFKAYIQYLVYWICNGRRKPVVSETNARYFFQAYIAVARVIDSVEQSVVASSAWVEPFRTSLYSYPDFAYSRISGIPGCDACHFHSNRTATFCVTLSGSPYKRTILAPPMPGEMVSEADDAEGEESDNVVTINDDSEDDSAKGKQAQPHFDYNLGKTCKLRSEICHELHHYLYHLANVVEIHLQTLELDSSQQSASGGGWEDVPPDDLVEMLDKRGQVDDLFQQFKELVSRSKSEFTS